MNPRLLAIAGPLAGGTFDLAAAPVTLGRHKDNDLQIRDLAVSRQHCSIAPAGDRFVLRDLESRHGTFVNGLPVRERDLAPGDQIQVGGSLFLFTAGEAEREETPGELLDDADYVAESTVHWPAGSPVFAALDSAAAAAPERTERDLARDLEKAIREGTFRADYRLSVITLTLPPLRERREDIPLLASHFAARVARDLGRPVAGFSPAARACLERYPWPGNVRELRNAIERAVVLGEGELIVPEDLPETVLETAAGGTGEPAGLPQYHAAVNDYKRRLIKGAVKEARGNISKAAVLLGLHPNYLHRLVTNLELRAALQDL